MVKQKKYLEIRKIGQRGTIFSFYEPKMGDTTISYLIEGTKYVFLIDTFLGSKSMGHIREYLIENNLIEKKLIIFITHGHWDHYWGNNFFPQALIISQSLCRAKILADGQQNLEKYQDFAEGEIQIVPPQIIFKSKLSFPEEKLEFFHTPGHTQCCASCYDEIDDVLIVGDNIEDPIPFLMADDLKQYISSLENYIEQNPKVIIPGHGKEHGNLDLVSNNLKYVRNVSRIGSQVDSQKGLENIFDFAKFSKQQIVLHVANMKFLANLAKENQNRDRAVQYIQSGLETMKHNNYENHQDLIKELEELAQ
ncbi:MAG: MBL fold metallo-hydrolase [Promethearchaeota archaeon]